MNDAYSSENIDRNRRHDHRLDPTEHLQLRKRRNHIT